MNLLRTEPSKLNAYGFIYKITNNINKKIYVGQTTIPISVRFRCHCNGKQLTMPIYHAIKKYGRENFSLEMIAICSNKEKLDKFEQITIKKMKSQDSNIGYNIARGGQPQITESGRKKISLANKNRKQKPESIEKRIITCYGLDGLNRYRINKNKKTNPIVSKPVIVINLISKEIKEYDSIHEAARQTGCPKSAISRLLKVFGYAYNNYKAVLKQNYDPSFNYFNRIGAFGSVKVKITNKLTNEVNIFDNQTSAGKFLGIKPTSVQRRIDGASRKYKNLNNYIFERV